MNDIKVIIDPGHGGTDYGAIYNDIAEKDLNLKISLYMADEFKKLGIPVTLTRSTDETLTPEERVARVLEAAGDNPNVVLISNHINSNETPNVAEGAEVIYSLRNTNTFARNILNELRNVGQVTRSYFTRPLLSDPTRDYFYILRETGNTQAVIVEYGFINNEADIRRIQENYKSFADAVIKATIDTFNIPTSINFFIVQSGDTLWSISRRFNTTVDELKRLNNLTSDLIHVHQVLRVPTGLTEKSNYVIHVVQSGDTLWAISRKYNTTVEAIKERNNLFSDTLYIGQVLMIPTIGIHIVRAGDTLWSISRLFNTTVDELKRLNGLTSDIISIGQIIKIRGCLKSK